MENSIEKARVIVLFEVNIDMKTLFDIFLLRSNTMVFDKYTKERERKRGKCEKKRTKLFLFMLIEYKLEMNCFTHELTLDSCIDFEKFDIH